MQRCPYLHEMKERLLGPTPVRQETLTMDSFERENENLLPPSSRPGSNQVGTVVKLNSDGYGAHTSPTHHRTPLVPRDLGENFNLGNDDDDEIQLDPRKPKNANNPYDDYRVYCQENKNKLRTSLFIVTSLVYAMLLIVVCVAYVISDVTTHRLPIMYYEGFFTYLYGVSILFLLYVFCFLLQESTCCQGSSQPKPPKQKKPKKEKPKKEDKNAKADAKDGKGAKDGKDAKAAKPSPYQEVFPKKKRDVVRESLLNKESAPEAEVATSPPARRRKTTHDAHGSFFLRVGAIAFGLGTMIYTGLEIGSFFEIPFDSPCHQILRGVNPLLQMIFTFMQMYFVFMNSRLNIHRFKVLARFGLMHIVATNICVWIRTLVLESLKEITAYHQRRGLAPEDNAILETIRQHTLKNAGLVLGTDLGPKPDTEWEPLSVSRNIQEVSSEEVPVNVLSRVVKSTVESLVKNSHEKLQNAPVAFATFSTTTQRTVPTTESTTTEALTTPTTTTEYISNFWNKLVTTVATTVTSTTTTTTTTESPFDDESGEDLATTTTRGYPRNWFEDAAPAMFAKSTETPTTSTAPSFFNDMLGKMGSFDYQRNGTNNLDQSFEKLEDLFPQSLTQLSTIGPNATSCGRVNIMGTIVQDSAPYLYPFIVEYSLIGAVVIYVMWRHIGRYPKFASAEDLEHRLEVMLSRRAVAMAQAQGSGKVDCVGASKGLFFGLLLLVGSLICLILFFVLVRHPQLSLLAIYLADASHAILMGFTIFAIIIGFIRVQNLKFRCEEQSNLNDILLRISAFGLFIYSTFSVIAGALNALESEPNLLVTVTGAVAILQVVFQLLFIADVSRRRVHLPEHDRSKPGRQVVTFLLICNVSMFAIYTFEAQKVFANPVQLDFYGFIAWSIIQRVTLPLCIFHRFHSAVTLAEIWKTTYKARLE